ncbi:hypothetical protein [Shewanella glacialipiscicola]|uniref:hypothetical protein n=1 Tax=Shewanella glacialipiscicola TaxID=614069 RepID=UPI003D7B0E47
MNQNKSRFLTTAFTYHIVNSLFEGLKSENIQHSLTVTDAIESVLRGAETLKSSIESMMTTAQVSDNMAELENVIFNPVANTLKNFIAKSGRLPSHIVVRELIVSRMNQEKLSSGRAGIVSLRPSFVITDEMSK